jgi:hypothetical protein
MSLLSVEGAMSIPIRSLKFWIHVFIPGDIYKIYTRIVPAGSYLSKILRKGAKLFTVLLLSLFASETVLADNFICGTKIIQSGLRVGLTQYEVARDCGEPVAVKGDRWIYVRSGKKITILVFDDSGQLVAIDKRP